MSTNSNMILAKKNKNDEFYTCRRDIENECYHYWKHFYGKTIFCNCDDPKESEFWIYFHLRFNDLGLKRLISTHYEADGTSYVLDYTGWNDADISAGKQYPLKGNGDFRSEECIELLKQADVVVTNPPFSLFREYLNTLIKYDKKFIIWGNNNAITYKDVFPLIKNNKLWLGYLANKPCYFRVPNSYEKWDEQYTTKMNDGYHYGKVQSISVFTNLEIEKRKERLFMYKKFNQKDYPLYDNYCAFNVDKVSDIPEDEEFELVVDEKDYARLKDAYGDDCELLEVIEDEVQSED